MRDTKGKFVKGHKAYDTTGKRPLFHGNSTSFTKGTKAWNDGKPMSDEAKEKMIASKIGKPAHNKGKKMSVEQREKLSAAHAGKKRPYCSGENSSLWKGGITSINLAIRSSLEYKLWRTAVFERDKYTCIWCGAKFIKGVTGRVAIHADHIKPFAHYPELRFAIDNGRTLCAPCHRTTDTYGYKANKKSYE